MESHQKDSKTHVKKFLNGEESFMVGNYCAKKKKIGMGSFATIYHAVELDRNREVAIKTIRVPDISRLADNITREIKIMKELNHPNIIRMYDIIYDKEYDNVHLILEYAPDGNLSDYLKRKGPIGEAYAKVYMKQLSLGLHYLLTRSNPIIHRDLKPQNILMFGDYGIKLTDFGFARNIQANDLLNTFCGTPLYMAPELLLPSKDKSNKIYTSKVDLWSIGIILYEMLTGKIPSYSKNVSQLSAKLRDNDFKLPSSIKVTPECRNLLEGLLVKDPHKRIEWEDFFKHPWFDADELMDKDNNLIQMADDIITSSTIAESSQELLKKFSSNMNSTIDSRLPVSKPSKELSDLHDSLQELRRSFYSKKNKSAPTQPKKNVDTISSDMRDALLEYSTDKDKDLDPDEDPDKDLENELFFSCELDFNDSTMSPCPQLPKTNIPIGQSKLCNLLDVNLSAKLDEVMPLLNQIWEKKKALEKEKGDQHPSKSYDPELSFNRMMEQSDDYQMVDMSFKDDHFDDSVGKNTETEVDESDRGKYVVITNPIKIDIRANSDITSNRATYHNGGFKYYLDNSINFLKESCSYFANNRKSL
jgi:serine/threonine protein kinase